MASKHVTVDDHSKGVRRVLVPSPVPPKFPTGQKSSTVVHPLGIPMQKSGINFTRSVMSFYKPEPRLIDVKSIVTKHHQLIVRNIVPSDELYSALEAYGVLAETMVNDVRVGSSSW